MRSGNGSSLADYRLSIVLLLELNAGACFIESSEEDSSSDDASDSMMTKDYFVSILYLTRGDCV